MVGGPATAHVVHGVDHWKIPWKSHAVPGRTPRHGLAFRFSCRSGRSIFFVFFFIKKMEFQRGLVESGRQRFRFFFGFCSTWQLWFPSNGTESVWNINRHFKMEKQNEFWIGRYRSRIAHCGRRLFFFSSVEIDSRFPFFFFFLWRLIKRASAAIFTAVLRKFLSTL